MTPKEISDIVRADILRELAERGDRVGKLSDGHLQSKEYAAYFDGAMKWLEHEGLISVGNRQIYSNAPGAIYSSAQLTGKGEKLLSMHREGVTATVKDLLLEAFRDAAKDGVKVGIKSASLVVWTTYAAWMAS